MGTLQDALKAKFPERAEEAELASLQFRDPTGIWSLGEFVDRFEPTVEMRETWESMTRLEKLRFAKDVGDKAQARQNDEKH